MLPELAQFQDFACLAFSGRGVESDGNPIWVTNDLLVHSKLPVELDEFWQTELGGITSGEIANSNTVFFALSPGGHSHEQLKSYLHSFHYGLLLQGCGYTNPTSERVMLAGPVTNGDPRVASIGEMLTFHRPERVLVPPIQPTNLQPAVVCANGIDEIYGQIDDDHYLRLRKGFRAFVLGLESPELYIRLHQFVRAIEAIVKPRRNHLKNDFKARGAFFVQDANADEILNDFYELRSAAEHFHPMQSKLERFDEADRFNVLLTRSYQSELLASFILRLILSDAAIYQQFLTDQSIDGVWALPEADLTALFSSQIDLEAASNQNFQPL